MNVFYEGKRLCVMLFFMLLFIWLCRITNSGVFAVLIVYALFALVSTHQEHLFFVMFFATTAMTIGGNFVPKGFVMLISQKLLLMMVAAGLVVNVVGRKNPSILIPVLWLLPYLFFIALSSQAGWSPIISNLKIVLFSMVFLALYGMSLRVMCSGGDDRRIRTQFLVVAIFVVFGSVLVRPFPSISIMGVDELAGYYGNEFVSLYKGVLNHSQMLGPTVGMISTFLFADLMFTLQKKDWLYFSLLVCCPILIYWTSSRTAMGSYLAGMGYVAYFALKDRHVKQTWRSKLGTNVSFLIIAGMIAVLVFPSVRDRVARFIAKSYRGDVAMEQSVILSSRQHKLDLALYNWRQSPLIGNGFQVSQDMANIQINGIKDVLSAPVEKSTWMYAVLEEGGIIGMILFCMFIVASIGLMTVRKAYMGAALLFQFVVINMGEFGIFSMSAEGGMYWCMVFIGLVFDYKRLSRQRSFDFARMQVMPYGGGFVEA